jgi:hypothetical protein
MVRLGLPREPHWLDLPGGVRLQLRPLTTAVMAAAQARAQQAVADLAEQVRTRRDAGLPLHDLPDLDDEAERAGLAQLLLVKALARNAILAWEGVLDVKGEAPAPVTPETVGDLMEGFWVVADAFLRQYTAPIDALLSEGNASRPSPPGTSVAGAATAPSAGPRSLPAPEAAAG